MAFPRVTLASPIFGHFFTIFVNSFIPHHQLKICHKYTPSDHQPTGHTTYCPSAQRAGHLSIGLLAVWAFGPLAKLHSVLRTIPGNYGHLCTGPPPIGQLTIEPCLVPRHRLLVNRSSEHRPSCPSVLRCFPGNYGGKPPMLLGLLSAASCLFVMKEWPITTIMSI